MEFVWKAGLERAVCSNRRQVEVGHESSVAQQLSVKKAESSREPGHES